MFLLDLQQFHFECSTINTDFVKKKKKRYCSIISFQLFFFLWKFFVIYFFFHIKIHFLIKILFDLSGKLNNYYYWHKMSITCKFKLSRISNIYYSGEEILGSITICSLKQRKIEAIILEFYGQSTVQWWELDKTEENIMHNDFSTQEVSSDKTLYYSQQKHVCEQLKLHSMNCQQLQPHVVYTFNFCFSIPQQIPATYRCLYGQTEYGLRLQIQHAKKVNKEFHQRIVVKNKLDLTQEIKYKEPYAVYGHNEFGEIKLQVPCNGFTPGQKIPYHIKYQTTQSDCKLLIQLNCFTTCRLKNKCIDKYKQIKQIINYEKHLSRETSSHVNIPLHTQISSTNDPELILSIEYTLEAILINAHKKALLSVSIPLFIGTTPCYIFEGGGDMQTSYLCYDNFGSSSTQLSAKSDNIHVNDLDADALFESLERKTHLRKSLRYCYKKLIKLI